MKIKDSILIVEDDRELCKSLSEILVNEGFAVITVNTGEEAIHQFSPTVDVIILDVMLPGMSGIDVCREIRRESFIPILFLTAKSEDADKLLGLIRQYARRDKPVTLCLIYDDTYIHIYLVNERGSVEATMMEPAHRHGIGVQNITRMMHKMGGKCDVQIKNEFYSVRLSFPFCEQ